MRFGLQSPEWHRREIIARFVIGFAAGALAVVVTDPDRPFINLFGAQRFLVDRILYLLAGSIVAAASLRVWYGGLTRANALTSAAAVGLSLWGNEVPYLAVRAALKPAAPALWASLFGNPATTIAYAPIYGLALGVILVLAMPLGRALLSGCFGDEPRWAARPRREDALFESYRRFYGRSEAERTSTVASERDAHHQEALAELDRMDRWRSGNTASLIDLLRRSYAMRSDPAAALEERVSVAQALDEEMIRVWGPPTGGWSGPDSARG